MKIAVVIAAYDERENIGILTSRLIDTLNAMKVQWTLIYVIEGVDGTLEIAQEFADLHPQIRILYNPSPSGLGRAFRLGFQAVPSDADTVVTMDADLNHQPEEIPVLIEAARQTGAGLVIGSRRVHKSIVKGVPLWKTLTSLIVGAVMNFVLQVKIKDMSSGFRVYSAPVLRRITFFNDDFAFLPEILVQAATMDTLIIERPIHFIYREAGQSKMAIWKTSVSYLKLFGRFVLHTGSFKVRKKPLAPQSSPHSRIEG
jgi:dolichol-phosphate mannosyltransferase